MMFEAFTDQLIHDAIEFKNYWRDEGAKNPKQFPRYMEEGSAEWYAHFFAYLKMVGKN